MNVLSKANILIQKQENLKELNVLPRLNVKLEKMQKLL